MAPPSPGGVFAVESACVKLFSFKDDLSLTAGDKSSYNCSINNGSTQMTAQERIAAALDTAKQGNFAEARSILNLVEMGRRTTGNEMQVAWAKFGKLWRGQ